MWSTIAINILDTLVLLLFFLPFFSFSLSLPPTQYVQTMAIATLAVCYNNPAVFTGVVKIRKGQAIALMMESTNMSQLGTIMSQFAEEV